MSALERIRLGGLAREAVRMLPDVPSVLGGLLRLTRLRPDQHGSIGALIARHARQRPKAIALIFEQRRWTYAEFNAAANRSAAVLRDQGVRPGDAVAVLMENRAELLIHVAGILKLGAIAGMLNHQQRGAALAHSLKLTQASVMILGEECHEAWQSIATDPAVPKRFKCLFDGDARPDRSLDLAALLKLADDRDPFETAAIQLKSPAFYIFTSGTTGLPKASVMTHYRWMRGMAGMAEAAVRLRGDDVLYCCLPLYHNNGLTVSWGAVLARGATLALSRKFSATRFWDEIRASGATSFCYIGELCRYLHNRPPSAQDRQHQIRVIVGNGLRADLWEDFQQRFGIERICEFYSASESNLGFVNAWNQPRTAGFCPLPYAIVAFDADAEKPLRDARGHLQRVPAGGIGLLLGEVSDRAPFDGYTDPAASEAKLFRDVFKQGDCWFNTGDLVRDQGFHHIQFVDRVGDTFRWKGENVATTEVEAALCAHPGIAEAVVYGVLIAGQEGRAGMASLSLTGSLKKFDGAALAARLREALPAYAVPLFLRLRSDQDTTATFKHRKVELKREGFDPAQVQDPLYVLEAAAYVPMTPARYDRIVGGSWRF